MFGIITNKFIYKTHQAFDELGYHEHTSLSFDEFIKAAIKTICLANDLVDAINAVRMVQFIDKNWSKVEKFLVNI